MLPSLKHEAGCSGARKWSEAGFNKEANCKTKFYTIYEGNIKLIYNKVYRLGVDKSIAADYLII